LNVPLTEAAAEAMASHFLEVIVAPSFEDGARAVLERKKNLRLIQLPARPAGEEELDYKRVRGGLLVQSRMSMRFPEDQWQSSPVASRTRGSGRTCGSPGAWPRW
jgi:AICAR transformylase/IMP cyclohydrolase PurH